MKSRTVGCPISAMEEGRIRAEAVSFLRHPQSWQLAHVLQLTKLSNEFVLRRAANVLDNYLPPKCQSPFPTRVITN